MPKHETNNEVAASAKKEDKPKAHPEGYHSHNDDMPNSATIAERKRQRDEVASEVEAFLAQGGGITSVDVNVRADPPKKPESNYGSRPI
jgi:SutA RNAP-binding domain